MYEPYFGLRQEPFSIAPDPAFLFMSDKHREALQLLSYGLTRGASFVLLTGEIGAGKTTVWRRFLESLPSNVDVASVVNPKLDVNALLTRVCDDLRVPLPEGAGTVDLIDALHGHLLLAYAQGRRTLIAIDEAQALSVEVLEQLRLLTNLDTSGKWLQVMLIGQPELRLLLERPALEPVAQRIVARYHLPTLSAGETASYIAHRLRVAGLTGPLPFDAESVSLIHRLCRGVPRRINAVCDRALAAAQADGSRRVDRPIVERAAADVFGRKISPPAPAPAAAPRSKPIKAWAVAGTIGVALVALVALAMQFDVGPERLAGLLRRQAQAAAEVISATAAPTVAASPAMPDTAAATAGRPPAAAARPVVAAAAAPVTAATPTVIAAAAKVPPPVGIDAAFSAGAADEAPAWRALAAFWGTSLRAGEPCAAAAQQALQCFRSGGGLAVIRQLDRPSTLRLAEGGRVAHVLLVGLGDDNATLSVGGSDLKMPLLQLARLWRGEFATYWRAPPSYRPGEIVRSDSELSGWLVERLAVVDGLGSAKVTDEALSARIAAFQIAQGLKADGLAGPLTLMQLSRASGIDEPRLSSRPAR